MPQLYGQPYKYELREKISELREQVAQERVAHKQTKRLLIFANAENEELKNKLRRMTELAKEIVGENERSIDEAVHERYLIERREAFVF